MNDVFTDALNAPAGRLAEILLKKMPPAKKARLDRAMQERLDRLVKASGRFGFLARVRLAAEVSFLFQHAPRWTTKHIVPMFNWNSPEASAAWGARKYSNYIGSPELFGLIKKPFLALFARPDLPDDEIRTFSGWLAVLMLANRTGEVVYPITATEARSALRTAGARSMASIAHRLAIEMEEAKAEEKVSRWRNVVGPVFQDIWPLDVELQSPKATFQLVQMLRATGAAFSDAADVIVPFVRPDPDRHTTVYSISEAKDDEIYSSSPEKMLDLLIAVIGDSPARTVYGLAKALERIKTVAPNLSNTRKFKKLLNFSGSDT